MKYKPKKLPKATTMRLQNDHTWKAPAGYKIVVMDRGLVSFNIPQSWVVTDMEPFTVRDAAVPDDKAGLQVTAFRLPHNIDMSGLPLAPMLLQATANPKAYQVLARSELIRHARSDLELIWLEDRFLDPKKSAKPTAATPPDAASTCRYCLRSVIGSKTQRGVRPFGKKRCARFS